MKCPNCESEIPGIVCEVCGEETPQESLYCYKCGEEVQVEEEGAFDLEDRILCSDETCTGVINEKGICGTCGKSGAEKSS
jgi:hypothetical protein